MRGAAATGFAAGLLATAGLCATGLATVFGAVLAGVLLKGVLEAATFEAVAFEPVAFAAVFAVLFGIALLLFFEDFAAAALVAFRSSLTDARTRLLVAPRLAAATFLETFETLFLRVFCDTACARKLPRPCSMFFTGTRGAKITHGWVRLVMCLI